MLSRVAERLYWMARYLERAENTARLLHTFSQAILDLPEGVEHGWASLLAITDSEEAFHRRYQQTNERNVVKFLIADGDNPSSLVNSIRFARENARTTREILPTEAWELINGVHLDLTANAKHSLARRRRYELLHRIDCASLQFTGLLEGAMERGLARRFSTLGRFLERADMGSRIVDVGAASLLQPDDDRTSPYDGLLWMQLLQTLNALPAYRHHMGPRVEPTRAVAFLIGNQDFPRALAACLDRLKVTIAPLPQPKGPLQVLEGTHRHLQQFQPDPLDGEALHHFLDHFQQDLIELGGQFNTAWFHPPQ